MSDNPMPVQEEINPESTSEDLDAQETVPAETPTESAAGPEDQIILLKDQLVRALADHDNFKKRKQKEFSELIQNANEKLLADLLPLIDDLERALKATKDLKPEDPKIQQFLQGFEIIYKKFTKILGDKGLKPMESVGQALDPQLHDALMQVDRSDLEANTIVDEHEKGYYLYDKVIRHAKVIVSRKAE